MSNTKQKVVEFVQYLQKATADVTTAKELANLGQLFLVELVAICLPDQRNQSLITVIPFEARSKDDNFTRFKESLIASVDQFAEIVDQINQDINVEEHTVQMMQEEIFSLNYSLHVQRDNKFSSQTQLSHRNSNFQSMKLAVITKHKQMIQQQKQKALTIQDKVQLKIDQVFKEAAQELLFSIQEEDKNSLPVNQNVWVFEQNEQKFLAIQQLPRVQETNFILRKSELYVEIDPFYLQNICWPNHPSYDNPIVAFYSKDSDLHFNCALKSGERLSQNQPYKCTEQRFDPDQVKSVIMWWNEDDAMLQGIEIFDVNENSILRTKFYDRRYQQHKVILNSDERIVGVAGRRNFFEKYGDLQLLIAKRN